VLHILLFYYTFFKRTLSGQAFECWANALSVVKAVIRRNLSPPDIVRKMKRTLPVLEGRMKEVGAHFDNYEPLLFERADAYKYTGVVNFDTLQFHLKGHPDFKGADESVQSTQSVVGFTEFMRYIITIILMRYPN
jgi:hypothetical protein